MDAEDESDIDVPEDQDEVDDSMQIDESSFNAGIKNDAKSGTIQFILKLPASKRRLLMVNIIEATAKSTMVRSTADIKSAFVTDKKIDGVERIAIQTVGSNFECFWHMGEEIFDLNHLVSNDIWKMREVYGVEAARQTIVQEITNVFDVYGITVDTRHLGLIADYMTFNGNYRAMNRIGMRENSSPLLKMSYETTAMFLVESALETGSDLMESPAARIVLGEAIKGGTGCFEVIVPTS